MIAGAAPASASSATDTIPSSIFLNTEKKNANYGGPELDRIRETAAADGVSLASAITDRLAEPSRSERLLTPNEPDGPVSTPSTSIDGLTAGELEDIASMATAEGITIEEGINKYGWQEEFVKVSDELERRYPDTFSGAEKLDASAWFAFKGAPTASALTLMSELPVPVEVVNRDFAESELSEAATVWAAAREAKGEEFASAYDIRRGVIVAELAVGQSDGRSGSAAKSTQSVKIGGRVFPVEVNHTNSLVSIDQDNYIRGGGHLLSCTAGFNLKNISSSTKRLGTAGHCVPTAGALDRYSNHSNHGGATGVDVVWTHRGAWGDLGYTSHGSLIATRTFYHERNKTRYVDSRAGMPSVGTSICHYGRTTNKSCSKVKYRDVSASGLKHMVVMEANVSKGGDSGGPWYSAGTAYGIHKGVISMGGRERSWFTPAYLFQNRKYDVWQR
ncbi:S1 family peptidase [Streptomyces sp. cmx-18-6]|uniref:S1 family peptidase n=1 Tax=Streptomyces sp. cmx-18-6 TaxID=2790930 RepID=UPI003980C34C